MSRVPETFRDRLALALSLAATNERRILQRARLYPNEIEQLLTGSLDPLSALGGAATAELAELLDVGWSWLAEGRPTAAARRLVYDLELLDMGGRVGAMGDFRVSASDYSRILARAASVPGAFEFVDNCERHPCGPTGSSGDLRKELRRGVTEA